MKREVVLACLLTAIVVSVVFSLGLHLGRAQTPSSLPSSSTPPAPQAALAPAPAPRPDTSALDNKVADYNIGLRQLDQYEGQIKDVDQQEKEALDAQSYEVAQAATKQSIALMEDRNALGKRSLAAYHEIAADPNFAANYRQTVYTTAHDVETLASWSNLRYIERH